MIITFTTFLMTTLAGSQVQSFTEGGNPSVRSIDYVQDQLVSLQSAPGYQLTVELAPDERIENVALGDSGAWQVSANKRGDRLFLKLVQPGVSTNMTVITDARLYVFELSPLPAPYPGMAYVVRFHYPNEKEVGSDLIAHETATSRYKVRGSRHLRPASIHDDGIRTYIEWSEEKAVPAVYAVSERGEEFLINGMMRSGRMVIDSTHPRLVFRVDDQKATAVRIAGKKN